MKERTGNEELPHQSPGIQITHLTLQSHIPIQILAPRDPGVAGNPNIAQK